MLVRLVAVIFAFSALSAPLYGRDAGGIAIGLHANLQHEFGTEADYLGKIQKEAQPPQFTLWRATVGGSIWQADDRGLDAYGEMGLCRGFALHGCIGVGLRQQNRDAQYLQSTVEVGTGFLFAAYLRPLYRIKVSDTPRANNRQKELDYELGVKIKWPVAVF
jgi:hypothetical protein